MFNVKYSSTIEKSRDDKQTSKEKWCDICNKSFVQNRVLEMHMKTVHENLTSYKCASCDKIFKQKGNLKRHLKTVHENIKPFKCDACELMFGQKIDLETHLKRVHEKSKAISNV